jgi:hypothetical protein
MTNKLTAAARHYPHTEIPERVAPKLLSFIDSLHTP